MKGHCEQDSGTCLLQCGRCSKTSPRFPRSFFFRAEAVSVSVLSLKHALSCVKTQPARASSDDLLLLQESPVRVSIHSEFRRFLRLSALKLAKYSTTVERRLHLALASVQERLMSVPAASIYRQGGDSCFCNVSLKPHIPKPKYCWVRLRN